MLGGSVLYNSSVWLYPDLSTAWLGEWRAGRMVSAVPASLTALTCGEFGLMEVEVTATPGAAVQT